MSECEGCTVYRNYEGGKRCDAGIPPVISEDLECPCRKCLVKMVCGTQMCDDLSIYIAKARLHQRKIFNKLKSDKRTEFNKLKSNRGNDAT